MAVNLSHKTKAPQAFFSTKLLEFVAKYIKIIGELIILQLIIDIYFAFCYDEAKSKQAKIANKTHL